MVYIETWSSLMRRSTKPWSWIVLCSMTLDLMKHIWIHAMTSLIYIDISISCSPLYGISSLWIRIIWPHNQVSSFNWPQAVWVMNAQSTWCHLIIIPVPPADRGKGIPGSNNTCKKGMYLGVFNGNGLDVLIYLSCDDLYVVCADDCIYASTYEVTGWCLTHLTLYTIVGIKCMCAIRFNGGDWRSPDHWDHIGDDRFHDASCQWPFGDSATMFSIPAHEYHHSHGDDEYSRWNWQDQRRRGPHICVIKQYDEIMGPKWYRDKSMQWSIICFIQQKPTVFFGTLSL